MILVDCTLSDPRVLGIAIVRPGHKRDWGTRHREGTELILVQPRSRENKGQEEKNSREDPDGLGSR